MTRCLTAIGPILLLASAAGATPLSVRDRAALPLLPPPHARDALALADPLPGPTPLEFSFQANVRMLRSGFVQATVDRSLSAKLMGARAVFREYRLAGPPFGTTRYSEAVLCVLAGAGLFAFGFVRRRAVLVTARPRLVSTRRRGPAAASFPTRRAV